MHAKHSSRRARDIKSSISEANHVCENLSFSPNETFKVQCKSVLLMKSESRQSPGHVQLSE